MVQPRHIVSQKYVYYICHLKFEVVSDWISHDFSIYQTSRPAAPTPLTEEMKTRCQAQMKAANTFRESSIFPGLKGGWRVPYERLGRLASIPNTIPKQVRINHQSSFGRKTSLFWGWDGLMVILAPGFLSRTCPTLFPCEAWQQTWWRNLPKIAKGRGLRVNKMSTKNP